MPGRILELRRDLLKSDEIRRGVHAQYPSFRACYENGLAGDVNLKGTVTLQFRVDPHGKVSKTRKHRRDRPPRSMRVVSGVIRNEVHDCKVVACLKAHMQAITFPTAERESNIVYPLKLEPADE